MPNPRFNAMISQHCSSFRSLYTDLAKKLFVRQEQDNRRGTLIHPGEYGSHRETVAKQFIAPFTPLGLQTGGGFVINSDGAESGQCDIIVFDMALVPFASNLEMGMFFPAEAVVCIGEVKSSLTSATLNEALNQLGAIRKICCKPTKSDAGVFSFLICAGVDTKSEDCSVEELFRASVRRLKNDDAEFRPHALLSVENGLLFLEDAVGEARYTYVSPGKSSTTHLKRFLSNYYDHAIGHKRKPLNLHEYYQMSQEDLEFPEPD